MRYTELENFIESNGLLECNVSSDPGIYAITIDNYIAYIGQSKNVWQRCSQHIYNLENASFNQEQKYLLLLSAKLGGHQVDCIGLCYCEEDELTEREDRYIDKCEPCLNILTPRGKQDISKLKIEDVLSKLRYCLDKEEFRIRDTWEERANETN